MNRFKWQKNNAFGKYYVLEGINGTGKFTQYKMLQKWFEKTNHPVYFTKEPTDGDIGQLLKQLLKEKSIDQDQITFLFAADRMEQMKKIRGLQKKGISIVSDRSYHSSLVYQRESIYTMLVNRGMLYPDRVFLLDMTPQHIQKRLSAREDRDTFKVDIEYLQQCREKYLWLADNYSNFVKIDASMSRNKVHKAIVSVIAQDLSES